VSLSVAPGEVHGLLGANGAGKSSLMRMIVGLARPSSGTLEVFGVAVASGLETVIDRVGALIDQPSFAPNLTLRQNLRLLARSRGFGDGDVDVAIEQLQLGEWASRRCRTHSHGVRQRLGLAAALLKQPSLLILDEPMNGLDPLSAALMTEVLHAFAASGGSVLLSSHDMAAVEDLCTSATILIGGRVRRSGTLAALTGTRVVVAPTPTTAASQWVAALAAAGCRASLDGDAVVTVGSSQATVEGVLARAGLQPSSITSMSPSLRDVFLELHSDEALAS
jgi:ABC-2 type transport system ATP-binding protein